MRKTVLTTVLIIATAFATFSCFGAGGDELLNSLRPQGTVNDFADVIDASTERTIAGISSELEQKTSAEIVVVTLQSLEGGEIDDFTNRLFERWGIGQKGKDNGLLLLAAIQDRKLRIEVGYGLEGVIPDSVAGRVRREAINPYFKKGQYGDGFAAGVAVLAGRIAEKEGVQLSGNSQRIQRHVRQSQDKPGIFSRIFNLILIVAFIIFAIRHPFLAILLLSGGRGGRAGGGFGGGGFGGGMSGGGGSSGGW